MANNGSVLSDSLNYAALYNAASSPRRAAGQAQEGTRDALTTANNVYGQLGAQNAPFIQQGAQAYNTLAGAAGSYLDASQQGINTLQNVGNTPLDVSKYYDPSMKFTQENAIRALEGSAAARGGVLSGATLRDITDYASGLASQNYNNAAQMALADRQQQIGAANTLTGVGQYGMTGLQNIGNAGMQAAQYQTAAGNNFMNTAATLKQNLGQEAAQGTLSSSAAIQAVANRLAGGNNSSDTTYESDKWLASDERVKNITDDEKQRYMKTFTMRDENDIYGSLGRPFSHMFTGTHPNDSVQQTNQASSGQPSGATSNNIQQTLDGINPVTYSYKPQYQQGMGLPSSQQTGVLAQDLEKTPALAGAVQENSNGIKQINVPQATGFALAALSQINDRLKKIGA